MGINIGLSNWLKFGRSLQKKFALACLGKKVTGKRGQIFLMHKCPVWEPWGIPRFKWGPHPKSRISSFKIDESPTLDVHENGSGYSPFFRGVSAESGGGVVGERSEPPAGGLAVQRVEPKNVEL